MSAKIPMTPRRLQAVLAIYAVLALAGAFLLTGNIRLVLWIVLGGLAFKSWAAYKLHHMPRPGMTDETP